jgi:hypothetical protein
MRRVKFFELSRNAQDRFIAATRGAMLPRPLAQQATRAPFPWVWAGSALVGIVAFVVLVRWGYGQLDSPFAIAPKALLGAAAGALVAALFCAGQAVARFLEARRLPFPRGHFLFPIGLVDATSYEFRIRSTTDLSAVTTGEAGQVGLRFADGYSKRLPLPDAVQPGDFEQAVAQAQQQLRQAQAAGDAQALAGLDPLSEPRYSNPLAPRSRYTRPTPKWRKLTFPLALLLGGVVGAAVGIVRNQRSERALYAAARHLDTPEAYQAYLARGGKRSDVAELLLPSAELRRVVDTGSLPALEQYAREHPASAIRPAIDLALRNALLRALGEAKDVHTMTALSEFASAHADFVALVQAELSVARRDLSRSFGERFLQTSAADTDGLEQFVGTLCTYLAQHGPEVEVRFQRLVPDSVERADDIVQRDKYFAKVMLPSQYFDAERSKAREDVLFEHLNDRFEAAFPSDVLRLVLAEPLLPGRDIPKSSERPTLYVSHSTNMGRGIPNQKPNGTFVGIGFLFKSRFVVPGDSHPLQMKYSVWRLPDLLRLRKGALTIPQVYLNMAEDAFGGFDEKLMGWLFRERSK